MCSITLFMNTYGAGGVVQGVKEGVGQWGKQGTHASPFALGGRGRLNLDWGQLNKCSLLVSLLLVHLQLLCHHLDIVEGTFHLQRGRHPGQG